MSTTRVLELDVVTQAAAEAIQTQLRNEVRQRILDILQKDLDSIVKAVVEQVTNRVTAYVDPMRYNTELRVLSELHDLRKPSCVG